MTVPAVRLTIYSDYLCPWCFNTLVRLRQVRQKWETTVQLTWKSYMLLPEPKEQSVETFHVYSQTWLKIASEQDAGEFAIWPLDRKPPNWSLPALAATKVAQTFGEVPFSNYQEILMVSYYRDHLNISDAEVLFQLAERCQIDRHQFEKCYQDPQWKELVWEEHRQAKAFGIHNVPVVVVNEERALAGTVSIEEYESVIRMYC